MQRTYVFRLYPKPRQEVALDKVLWACRKLYNATISQREIAYADGHPVSRFDQERQLSELRQNDPQFGAVYCHVLQDVVRRVDLAFRAFFRRVAAGETPGYPRVRGR